MTLEPLSLTELILYLANLADERIYPYPGTFIHNISIIALLQLLAVFLGVFKNCRNSRSYRMYMAATVLALPVLLIGDTFLKSSVVSNMPIWIFSLAQTVFWAKTIKWEARQHSFAVFALYLTLTIPFCLLAWGGYLVNVVYPN